MAMDVMTLLSTNEETAVIQNAYALLCQTDEVNY